MAHKAFVTRFPVRKLHRKSVFKKEQIARRARQAGRRERGISRRER